MAKGYLPVERDQLFLLPADMREWLPADHAVHVIIELVALLDTEVLHRDRKLGGPGAAGFDPDMLVTMLIWGYSQGITSSRVLEELCRRDASFRLICGGRGPDHTVICRFRRGFPGVIADLYAKVLILCARLGLGELGMVTLDGTKVKASASLGANRSEEHLRKLAEQAVAAHAAADQAADEAEARRARRPRGGSAGGTRAERAARALAGLEADQAAAAARQEAMARAHAEAAAAGAPVRGLPAAGAEVALAGARAAAAEAAQQARIDAWEEKAAAQGKRPRGARPAPVEECARVLAARKAADAALARDQARAQAAARERGPVRNVTDPGSRIMTTATGGFMQGYNAQNLVTADGIIIATTLTSDANDVAWLGPMLAAAEEAAALIAAHRPPARPGEPGGADQASQASADQASQASTDQASQASADQASQASTDQASQASTDQASQASTDQASQASTDQASQASTDQASQASTDQASQASTDQASQASTDQASQASTDQASQASTDQASQASTDQASQASTDQASQASTDQASQASTDQASADQAGGGQYQGLIGLVLADAGYLSARNLALPGPDRLIATGKHRDLERAARDHDPGPPGDGGPPGPGSGDPPEDGPIAAMAARLRTPDGIAAYRQRGHIAETPHGYIKQNMGIRQLTQRGDPHADAEWKFTVLVANLCKAITSGHATRAALAALTS